MNLRESQTIDDMVFESRNKEYGSYQLRKHYVKRLVIGFIASVSFFLLISLGYLWYLNSAGDVTVFLYPNFSPYLKTTQGSLLNAEELDAYMSRPAARKNQQNGQNSKQQADPLHSFTVAEDAEPDTFIPEEKLVIHEGPTVGDDHAEDSLVFGGFLAGNGTGEGYGGNLDRFPEFPGGIAGVTRYLERNVQYPIQAIKQKISGVVLISFEVNRIGVVENIRIERGVDPIIDTEAIKAIRAMPRWKPGMRHGRPVPVKFIVPVNFIPMS